MGGGCNLGRETDVRCLIKGLKESKGSFFFFFFFSGDGEDVKVGVEF
jgi:hypothetical protein